LEPTGKGIKREGGGEGRGSGRGEGRRRRVERD